MITKEIIKNNLNKYIRLGGFGILDGLKGIGFKQDYYKIVGLREGHLILKPYRAKKNNLLPHYKFNQSYEIITEKEFKLKRSVF